MKKNLFLLLLTINVVTLFAQAKKYPIALHFTNSNCPNCSSYNPSFFNKIDLYPKDIHHIAIHPSFPYKTCVFYQENITDNTGLVVKYDAKSTPSVSMNGAAPSSVTTVTDAQLKILIAEQSPISIEVAENTGTNRSVKAKVKTVGTLAASNYVIYAAVVEKVVNQKTGNGETVHRDVLRKLLTKTTSDAFTPAALNVAKTVDFNYSVDAKWQENQIYTIVWVQDASNKILNSGSKFDATVGVSETYTEPNISIYPNPSSEEVNVDLSKINATPISISILSIDGREIANYSAKKENNKLNISNLDSGIFIVSIKTNEGVLSYNCLKK